MRSPLVRVQTLICISIVFFLFIKAANAQVLNLAQAGVLDSNVGAVPNFTGAWVTCVQGNYTYSVGGGNVLEITDITIPGLPQNKGRLENGEGGASIYGPRGLFVSGNYAYIPNFHGASVEIVDISDPENPKHAALISGGSKTGAGQPFLNRPHGIFVLGKYAYVVLNGDGGGLEILDVTDPTNPLHKGKLWGDLGNGPYTEATGIHVAPIKNKLYAFIAVTHPSQQSVAIIDVTDPVNPILIKRLTHGSLLGPTGVSVTGNSLFVASPGTSTVTKWNVVDPVNPVLVATASNPGGPGNDTGYLYRPWTTNISGKYVNIWSENGSIALADTTNLSIGALATVSHSSIAAIFTPARQIAVQGNYIFVPASNLIIFEASNPATIRPFIKTTVTSGPDGAVMGAPDGVFVYEGHAYVANNHGNLEVLDVSDPTSMKHVSSVAIGAPLEGPRSVFVFEDMAYLVSDKSFEIVDVSNPAAPIWKGKLADGGAGAPYIDAPNQVVVAKDIFQGKKYAYVVSTGSNALEIIDVNNPAAPVHFGAITDGTGGATLNGPTHVVVRNEYAYVLSRGAHAVHGGALGALEIVNVSFPNLPAHVRSVGSVGSNLFNGSISARGGNNICLGQSGTSLFAYILDASRKQFQVVNVTNPATASLVATLNNNGNGILFHPRGVMMSTISNHVLLAYHVGVAAVDVTTPTAPAHSNFIQTGSGNSQMDNPTSIFVSGKYAFVSNIGVTSNINVVDIYSPGITNFNPKTGSPGTPVTISGINLNTFITASMNGVSVPITSVASNSMNVTIPTNGTIGKITLAYNNQRTSTATNFVVTPTPTAATTITQNGFTANWSNVRAANYFLDITTSTDFSTFVTGYNNKSVGNVTSFSPADLTVGTTYRYRVRSNDGATNSTSSTPVITVQTIAATPVTNPATAIGQNNFTFSWNSVTSATDYYVDVATDANFTGMLGNYNNLKVPGTSLTVNALAAGTPYFYRVRVGNSGGISPSSTVAGTITLPSGPVAIQPSQVTTSGFTTNWEAVTGATGYRIDISTDNFATFVTGFDNKDVGSATSTSAELSASTSYQFRIKAYNASGTSPNSNIVSVLTLTPTPSSQPTNLMFSNVEATSVSVAYTAATGNPNGYLVLRSLESFTGTPVNGTTYSLGSDIGNGKVAHAGPAISFFDGGLLTGKRYHYTVFSFNGAGVAINYLTTTPLTSSIVLDSEAPVISLATAPNPLTIVSGNTPIFNAKIKDNVKVASAQIYYKGITRRDFKSAPMNASGGEDNYQVQIQTDWYDSLGLEYYFSAKDETGNTSSKPASSFVQLVNTSISLPALPSGDSESNYRIVSFPYTLAGGNAIASVYANVEWNDDTQSGLWWWNPSLNNGAGGYDKYGPRSPSLQTIEPGKGYWVITRSPVTPQLSNVPAPRYSRSNLFQMTLKPGWNQVGNPYPVPLSWEDVRAFNQRINPTASFSKLTIWNGTALIEATDNTKLKAYEGGFVKNLTSADITILIPFPNQQDVGGRTPGMSTDLGTGEWKVYMHISQGNFENKLGGFGMHGSADIGEDRYDSFSPPMLMEIPELTFSHKNRSGLLSSDIVGTHDGFTWSFVPRGTADNLTRINWSNDISIPGDKQLLLFDEETLNLTDMTQQSSYSFNLSPASKFRIFYGRDAHNKIFSENIAASTPFPNPTRHDGQASLKLSLPDEAGEYSVTIRVFNMQGKQMHSLTRTFRPGLHQFDVDLSSEYTVPGVYFYKVHVASLKSEKTLTGKIIKQ